MSNSQNPQTLIQTFISAKPDLKIQDGSRPPCWSWFCWNFDESSHSDTFQPPDPCRFQIINKMARNQDIEEFDKFIILTLCTLSAVKILVFKNPRWWHVTARSGMLSHNYWNWWRHLTNRTIYWQTPRHDSEFLARSHGWRLFLN